MRFIVKPAGIIAVAVALAGLGYLALRPVSNNGKSAALDAAPVSVTLKNADFEQGYKSFQQTGGNGNKNRTQISGQIALGWTDTSEGDEVTARYSDDKRKPHGGAYSQRIEIGGVTKGTVQIAQSFAATPGAVYRATLWVRASERTEVVLGLRREGGDHAFFEQIRLPATRDWRIVEVMGTVGDTRASLVLTANQPNITLWVDDAKVEAVKATSN
jgi:hypothetical protein